MGNPNSIYIIEPAYEQKKQYTWNLDWISPFESPWGIFEKFKFANHARVKDILRYFSSEYVQSLKVIN
jgi:hypothetical protein